MEMKGKQQEVDKQKKEEYTPLSFYYLEIETNGTKIYHKKAPSTIGHQIKWSVVHLQIPLCSAR